MFEVFRGKTRVAFTEDEKCLPSKETMKQMRAEGYRFTKDGKPWNGGKDDGKNQHGVDA